MLKRLKFVPITILLLFFLFSCSAPTIESDAEKAAELYRQSIEYSLDGKLDKAEKSQLEIQTIMDKYRRENKIKEFHQIYNALLEEKAEIVEKEYFEQKENK